MNESSAATVISAGLDAGADFVDLYEEETRNASVSLRDRKVENATAGIEYGIGLRLVYGTDVVYGYTGSGSTEAFLQLLRALVAAR
ncbi:MAG TPA: DNA gyrase modulator, partial [Turneriella sp.]|nr:DNA gyrase modulator [Turneriella sp.]